MESLMLSSVSTIMGIVRDIMSAVDTASQNKSRCKKVAERVRCIKDILEALQAAPAQDGTTSTSTDDGDDDAATRRLLKRLEEALSHALEVVRRYNRSSSFLIRSVSAIVAGGRMADPLDAVEADIDRCILDINLANSLRIARLETLLVRRQNNNNMAAAASTEAHSEEDDDDNDIKASEEITTAIGVPVCTAATAVEHEHEMVTPPPPSYGYYGYCWSCRSYHYVYHHSYYWRNHGCAACDCRDDGDAGEPPSGAAFYDTRQYSSYPPSMFSDDDPNSCSIM